MHAANAEASLRGGAGSTCGTPRTSSRPTCGRTPTRTACARCSPTCWTTRRGTARPGGTVLVRATGSRARRAARGRSTRARACRRPSASGSSTGSTGRRPPTTRHRRDRRHRARPGHRALGGLPARRPRPAHRPDRCQRHRRRGRRDRLPLRRRPPAGGPRDRPDRPRPRPVRSRRPPRRRPPRWCPPSWVAAGRTSPPGRCPRATPALAVLAGLRRRGAAAGRGAGAWALLVVGLLVGAAAVPARRGPARPPRGRLRAARDHPAGGRRASATRPGSVDLCHPGRASASRPSPWRRGGRWSSRCWVG